MSKIADGAWSVVKKAATWACYGAVTLGVLSMPLVAGAGLASSILGTSWGITTFTTALMYGAGIGGLFGTIAGVAGAPEAAQEAADDRAYRQRENQAARDRAVAERSNRMQQAQAQSQGNYASSSVSPDAIGYGQNRAQGVGV